VASGEIPVKFTYQPLTGGKHQVFLVGDFNNWSQTATLMEEIDGIYEITLYLKQGKYGYKFIVDGRWIADENADEFADDGYGGENSIIFVGNKKDIDALRRVDFAYRPENIVKEVYLVGSMNDWNQKSNRMLETERGVYSISILLKPDEYHYKFLEDGMHWITDENAKSFVDDGFGGQNSIIFVGDKKDINALRKVEFFHHPENNVKEVYLVGSMNDWNQNTHRMLKTETGAYSISLLLEPDEYHYKFIEDGMNWIADQNAKSFVDDGFEGENSVIIVDGSYEKVTIKKKDGIFLDYGIQTLQNLETVNPLTPIKIEFRTKAHRDDVDTVDLIKDDKRIKMNKIADDGSFDYFQTIIILNNEDEEFDYCFVYNSSSPSLYTKQ
jgi:hypothetical protein